MSESEQIGCERCAGLATIHPECYDRHIKRAFTFGVIYAILLVMAIDIAAPLIAARFTKSNG